APPPPPPPAPPPFAPWPPAPPQSAPFDPPPFEPPPFEPWSPLEPPPFEPPEPLQTLTEIPHGAMRCSSVSISRYRCLIDCHLLFLVDPDSQAGRGLDCLWNLNSSRDA